MFRFIKTNPKKATTKTFFAFYYCHPTNNNFLKNIGILTHSRGFFWTLKATPSALSPVQFIIYSDDNSFFTFSAKVFLQIGPTPYFFQ